ncbi:urease accessory protein UreH [Priestia megaterium]|uniref:HoxN/HupN/NixA family nickel/cobalt transporter n=1 Tax=Priestia megaterium TaxID=1404 RepID=UPI000BF643D9|nr:urease accessory protein UreH [Priestia megaterium]PEZ10006.1 urease accessory protein UreH [Priestia megaterium]
METSFFSILILGFFLGIKHALEPDHIIAVSTIASKSKKLWRSSLAGVYWGIGHTLTLFIFGMILMVLKSSISERMSMSLEFLVGIMLVYLGFTSFLSYKKQVHTHHEKTSYLKSLGIGFVHGLAGSAAMVVLTMSTVTHVWQGALYIIIFGIGTCLGMLLFTTVIGIPFVTTKKQVTLNRCLMQVTGAVSIIFGLYYMYNLGVSAGLFSLWF